MEIKSDFLFEASWEVCNKVGGIYTVVKSKIGLMLSYYKNNYFTLGPYFNGKTRKDEFKEEQPDGSMKAIFDNLSKEGIICHYGKWRTEGEPNTILIDFEGYKEKINSFKGDLWVNYKIDSLGTQYYDFDEPVLWSLASGRFLEEFKKSHGSKKVTVHCHEWLAGCILLYLKMKKSRIATIFTTHATMLGRTLAGHNIDLYGMLEKLNPEEEARKYGIQAKFLTEKACAQNSDVFTTVSEITGIEATHFLSRKPDILLPNGLDIDKFPTFEDCALKHKLFKGKLKRFLLYHFFPYYPFDLDDTLIFFLAGRYEFQNKGIDVYIKALGKLNEDLKNINASKTVVAFIWVPGDAKEPKPSILESRTYYEDIEDSIHDTAEELKDRIVYGILAKKKLDAKFLLGDSLMRDTDNRLARFSKEGNPPVCTHKLGDEENDSILNAMKECKLNNSEEDRVKVIFYPIYLTGADNLLDLNYYEGIMASHLGVFPSYYEPWGYTPAETGALGVASVTTDLAGFGRYINKCNTGKKCGIFVLERHNKNEEEVASQLASIFKNFVSFTKQERIDNKITARELAAVADWRNLIENYIKAHNMAVEKGG